MRWFDLELCTSSAPLLSDYIYVIETYFVQLRGNFKSRVCHRGNGIVYTSTLSELFVFVVEATIGFLIQRRGRG